MARILLFHHAQGLTAGVREWAATLEAAGHTVHVPDLYEGNIFETLDEGIYYAEQTGFGTVIARGIAAADGLPDDLVYMGTSLGVMPAQQLTQTRPGARAAVLLESCAPPDAFGAPWPEGVPVQIHGMDADPFFAGEGDIDAARALVASIPHGELFVYPGDQHLFTDSSLPSHDEAARALVVDRVLQFLSHLP